ncbi:MAG: hypothetical protein L3J87_00515 [Thermoplasmata archaeon]|nr:hypothetical protein [Thermoplasmata archaeon]
MSEPSDRWGLVLARLGRDRSHGASHLARAALGTVREGTLMLARSSHEAQRSTVDRWGRLLAEIQPAMGLFVVAGSELRFRARTAPPGELLADVRSYCVQLLRRIDREPPAIARVARDLFPPHARVVTLSRSATLFRVLTSLKGAAAPSRVSVLRSLPGGEGAGFGRALRAAGVRAVGVEDELRDRAVAPADLVLVGADSLFRDGSISHKIGTQALAESAARWHVPFIVATGLSKLVPDRDRPRHALPPLFDRTLARRIREYWTDAGRWTREEVAHEAHRRRRGRSTS